ncbi:acetate--CoA ligase [Legionella jordanis]|uniref:Acetate--CoA ligase n=1 Tax=Legionella jordanis TaxID=456 RepID=A0A0W0VC56_9GAMM|nr:acetate--CoA ligase [Legionella jordanis]KTD17724.1 acetyl-coenzyme A synthetase [Legionella jordanis]RMX01588.1 acetate--CoA ligase [Legionella jordanis]RMX21584.1 acetate--CoA ligase [Legionella jordanis]VEH11342.1 acetyl-CoA synthetase [Legionella jordanis]HAT8714496.1 acetate--CoA ligase [Legionella jordanis]
MTKRPFPTADDDSLLPFWHDVALEYIDWIKPWDKEFEGGFAQGQVKWFQGAKLNATVNCLDRHLPTKANQPAIIWEGDDDKQQSTLSFGQLHEQVCLMANVLKSLGVGRGDRVALYLPMIAEAVIATLACARIGAVHCIVFAGFSPAALRQRLQAAECKLLITADGYFRGGKHFPLKQQADAAANELPLQILLIQNSKEKVPFNAQKDHWWHELRLEQSSHCEPEAMNAEDPLFILYTSGSTGKPKGLVHSTGGYLVQVAYSFDYIFNCAPTEIFWCTADIGWITGHSYVIYGPLANGITSLMYAGVPNWPTPARCWEIIDRHQVNVFYTAPTAIRALKREGDQWLSTTSRKSLRLLGTVGEPINPEVWEWYQHKVGLNSCPIVDTWWQTETGAIMICPQGGVMNAKPGAASQPLPGIFPVILNEQHEEIKGMGEGILAIKKPWPSIARTIAGNHERYCKAYFANDYYITGDGAKRDKDGDFWITGRIDDVLNVAGHRLSTAEIESSLVTHPKVAEAAVVSMPDEIKGQGIHAYVTLKEGEEPSPQLYEELVSTVKNDISSIAKPDEITWVRDLPKTRSGKIMRRILRQIANNHAQELSDLGDLSTLANPQVVEDLLKKEK